MRNVLEDDGRSQQLCRAVDDRLCSRPIEAQLRVRLMDLLRVFELRDLLCQKMPMGELCDSDEFDPLCEDDDGQTAPRGGCPDDSFGLRVGGGISIDELDVELLDSMTTSIGLSETIPYAQRILAGETRGRTVVDVTQ